MLVSALVPVIALILVGYVLKQSDLFPGPVWTGIERLVYLVLLPALLVVKLGTTDLAGFDVWPMALAMAGATLVVTFALALARPLSGIDRPLYTSILQGAIRQNSFIGLAAAEPLYGGSGLALAAVGIAAVIPMVNVISVWSLAALDAGGRPGVGTIAVRMLTSPIIIACAIGLGINAAGVRMPDMLVTTLDLLAGAALPLGLLAVGAGLAFRVAWKSPASLLCSTVCKLLVIPALAALFCHVQGVDPVATGIAVLFTSLPSSASAYVMARQFGGDHEMMATILTTQTILAAATVPFMVGLLG
ncbi:MAG: AEC family transporter [Alphaproteobacteria bacterium]|nr:AEC family transporter [Alphaproteobacteria bacterium]